MFLSRGDRDLGVAFQTHPGRQAFISSGSKEARSALESRRGMPPVLHVPFLELPGGGAEKVLAHELGAHHRQRHDVLDLIAETVRAAGLIERGSGPDSAGERLIKKPAVEKKIHGVVRRSEEHTSELQSPTNLVCRLLLE